jgi:hypothetical protein
MFTVFGICTGLVLGACGADRDRDDDVDELQALLRDDALTGPASATRTTASTIRQPFDLSLRRWAFEDCTPERTELFGTGGGAFAYRSVGVTCAPGALGNAVALAATEDIVYVPDQPHFTFEGGVTVAGWFRPVATDQTQTLVRKRDKGTSAFALVLHRGRFRFVVNLGAGTAASVTSPDPARAGVFQHVAASYDGAALRLYVDGQQVAVRNVAGAIPPGPGPLLIGNDGSERRFDGVIDEAVFEVRALPPAQLLELTCLPVEPTVVVTPAVSAPTPPDVPVTFDVAVTNHNPPACRAMELTLQVLNLPPNLTVDPTSLFLRNPPVPSGGTTHFALSATPFDTLEGETNELPFEVAAEDFGFFFSGSAEVVVSAPAGCHVSKVRELMINAPSVTFDPIRTNPQGPAGDPRVGTWSFKHLVEEMAPTPGDAPVLVEAWLRSFTTPQIINGFTVEPRPGMTDFLAAWPRTPDGKLNLDLAPVRLKAIVNRIDLRDLDHGNAGEGSFIFAFVQNGFELSATLIFEYQLPATTEADVVAWAQAFHGLGAVPFSEPYNAALQAITERFVRRGARPDGVNGSALHAVRSNEFSFGRTFDVSFELREFRLSPATGRLVPSPLDRTPDQGFNFTFSLIDFIADNRDAIIAGTYTVPDQLGGEPFRAGAILNSDPGRWDTFEFDAEGRRAFALGTCNGCHSFEETLTGFQHVETFNQGIAALSPFLRGVTVPDPFTHEPRTFNDLRRRREDLEAIVCPAAPTVSLRRGISRVH